MEKKRRDQVLHSGGKKYTLKEEYKNKVIEDVALRERIAERKGGTTASLKIMIAKGSKVLNDIDFLMIIAKYYDKDLFDIIDIDQSKPY